MKIPGSHSVSVPATDPPSPVACWAGENPGCRLVVLFGSEPKGRAREGRDLDLAVLFDPLPAPEDRLRIIGELEDLAAPRVADVVFLRPEIDPVLCLEIFRDGECLYCIDRALEDFGAFLDHYRAHLAEWDGGLKRGRNLHRPSPHGTQAHFTQNGHR